ncbi:MAG: type II toxin-antitoxin system HicB family antitoxin [Thermoanaerobaculia bacterium]|nr:type II toxin-antitoxin system HicB family antitoxin [Thermoanaerobaculia bacterium]
MESRVECEREEDGRWLAEIPELPGVLAYGSSRDEAMARARVLALQVLAERVDLTEAPPRG